MLTLDTLTEEQKEFLEECNDGDYDKKLDLKAIKSNHKFVEYGNSLHTKTFIHAGIKYEVAYVFETGPGTTDWIGDNASSEDVYLITLEEKNLNKRLYYLEILNKHFKNEGNIGCLTDRQVMLVLNTIEQIDNERNL